jgi:protein-L-isoaspartate(D-aspartate) O-methyltransferase
MRGTTAHPERSLPLTDDVVLDLDAADIEEEEALGQALTYPAHEHWTGVTVADHQPVEHLDLWLATTTSRFARLSAGTAARESALVNPALRWAGAALYDGGTLAYLVLRPLSSESTELGVIAHGSDSDKFATQTANLLHRWNRQRPTQPVITAYPADTPDDQLPPGTHIDRPNTRLTIAW